MRRELYARKRERDGKLQTLEAHLANVASLSEMFSRFPKISRLIGLLHDVGKASTAFQDYLLQGVGKRGSVVHSFQGVYLSESMGKTALMDDLLNQFVMLVVSSHHGILPDVIEVDGSDYFDAKFHNVDPNRLSLEEVFDNIKGLYEDMNIDIMQAYKEAVEEVDACIALIKSKYKNESSAFFALGLILKYLFSCLIDSDRTDAHSFDADIDIKKGVEDFCARQQLWMGLVEKLEAGLADVPKTGRVAKVRDAISMKCREAAIKQPDIYRLFVPTGGGKTLSSLRFALEHAKLYQKKRIIYVIPFLSIICQTARTFESFLVGKGENAKDIILEHHSDVDVSQEVSDKVSHEFACARWDKPIIITTMVNFLETMMSAKRGNLRKLHNMQDSVIIFDEIQSLPIHSIHLFNEVANFLSNVLGATILLCSATQPKIEATERYNLMLAKEPFLIDLTSEEIDVFKRTYLKMEGGRPLVDFIQFAKEKAAVIKSALIILNTKMTEHAVFAELRETDNVGRVFPLSTDMCPAHRKDVLGEIETRLAQSLRTTVVSTQLVEAGVDLSFDCVIRAFAGLDSLIQAAGRCDRHGKSLTPMPTYVVPITDDNTQRIDFITKGKQATEETMRNYEGEDYMHPDCLDDYYNYFYSKNKDAMDYITKNQLSVYEMLAKNDNVRRNLKNTKAIKFERMLAQSFETADRSYKVINNNTVSVIVYYKDSEKLIEEYKNAKSIEEKLGIIEKLGQYSVSLYKGKSLESLIAAGKIQTIDEDFGLKVLDKECYGEAGVISKGGDDIYMI